VAVVGSAGCRSGSCRMRSVSSCRVPAEIDDEALDCFFKFSGADLAEARQCRRDGNRLGWLLRLCGLRMLGFCLDGVAMAPACRPDALVFSPPMLLPAHRTNASC
jgi:Domain of unknown function (DUF4158)